MRRLIEALLRGARIYCALLTRAGLFLRVPINRLPKLDALASRSRVTFRRLRTDLSPRLPVPRARWTVSV
jgi:hypothetical protein